MIAVGDLVAYGFRTGRVVRLARRSWGEVAYVQPLALTVGDGYAPTEVPTANLRKVTA